MSAKKKFLNANIRARIVKMMEYVRRHPSSLNQNSFPSGIATGACNTPYCAAGHAVFVNTPSVFPRLIKRGVIHNDVNWIDEGLKALGLLKRKHEINTNAIFGGSSEWPYEFSQMYNRATYAGSPRKEMNVRAKAFLARWQSILDTDGVDIIA